MPENTNRSVHINTALSSLLVGWHPEGMIAEQVMTVLPVKNETDFYYVWNKGDAMRRVPTLRADGGRANRVDFGYSRAAYICDEYALETQITDRVRNNADSALQLQLSKTRRVQDLVLLDQEARVADLLQTTGNYASTNRIDVSSTATNQWNNAAFTGNIEKVFDDARDAVRLYSFNNVAPTIAIIPSKVADVVKRDSKVRDLIKYTHSDLITNGGLPPRLWNLHIVTPTVVEATDREVFGADSPTPADIWGKHVILTMKPSGGSVDTPAHCYIFRARDVRVETWRDEPTSSDWYRVGYIQTEKVVSNVAGYLMQNVIA